VPSGPVTRQRPVNINRGKSVCIEALFRHSHDETKETLIAGVPVEILCHLVPLLGNVP
jgi:hypothetical protein